MNIPADIANRKIIDSICDKSVVDGMTTKSKKLNLMEYQYISRKQDLLPLLPKTAESIDIKFYEDSFLGDFILEIKFECSDKQKIDTQDNHRFLINPKISYGKKLIEYENHAG